MLKMKTVHKLSIQYTFYFNVYMVIKRTRNTFTKTLIVDSGGRIGFCCSHFYISIRCSTMSIFKNGLCLRK